MTADASWVESMPEVYDRCLGPALFAPYAEHLAAIAATLQPRRVLELAAGTGIATAALVRALPSSAITATDLNPAMVSWGAERVPAAEWQPADAQHLEFPDAVFDLVVCQFGVMFFPDKPAAFAEAERVLAPGGTVLLAVWDVMPKSDFPAALMASLAATLPGEPPSFIVRVPHGYTDADQIRADLDAGGLRADSVDRVVLRGRAPSAASLAEGFCLGTPLRFALAELGRLDRLTDEIAADLTQRLGDGPVDGDLAAIVVTARKA